MLNAIVSASLRFKGIVTLLAAMAMGYGLYLAFNARLDVFPDFVPPQVTIQTEAPGLSPEEVESLVTFPIEAAIGGIAGLETTRSESIQGLSVVDVIFADNTSLLADRQLLSERLIEVGNSLPSQAKAPTLSPMVSSTMDLLKIGLVSDTVSQRELRSFADWTLRPLLKSVAGVAEVTVVGGEAEEMQILPDATAMAARGVSLDEVLAAAVSATGIRGVGYVETPNQRLTLRANAPAPTVEAIGAAVVRGAGADALLLRDVATVTLGAMPKFGDALINGRPGVLVALTSQYGANTLTATQAVESALQAAAPLMEANGITLVDGLHRPANFIEIALSHLNESLLLGGALVAVVLVLFLVDLRTAFVSFVSIPLSLLSAVAVLRLFGVTLDTMALGGLAVAVGVVVDDAIIDVENILRRLRENAVSDKPQGAAPVILKASIEVRGAVIYATLVVLAVFLPVFALSGLQGRFFAPLAIAFVLAVLASLVTAVTVIPALCLLFLSRSGPHKEPFYIDWLKRSHTAVLRRVARAPHLTWILCALCVVGAALLGRRVPTELLPSFREGHFVLQVFGVPGSSLGETMRLGRSISDALLTMDEVATVEMQAGRSEKGVDTWGPERCEFHVELKKDPGIDEAALQERIRRLLESYENVASETLTFLGDRISESLTGETAAVVVSVFGRDLDSIDEAAGQVEGILGSVPGAIDARALGVERSPSVRVELSSEGLAAAGISPVAALDAIEAAYQGVEVGQLYEGSRIVPIAVRLSESQRASVGDIGALALRSPNGALYRLDTLGAVFVSDERASISHESGRRRQVVTCNVEGRSVADFVNEARAAIAERATLPEGVYLNYGGAAEAEAKTHRELLVATLVTLVLIGVFLNLIFPRLRNLLLVLCNLPFAVAGGIVAIYLTGQPLSLGALVGFVTLFGLSTRNAIMLMSHYEHLVREEGFVWGGETALRGARERLVPVVMTAAVTGLALLPLALSPGTAGREIEGPMAIAILGGLVSSTFLTVLALPTLALRFGRFGSEGDV